RPTMDLACRVDFAPGGLGWISAAPSAGGFAQKCQWRLIAETSDQRQRRRDIAELPAFCRIDHAFRRACQAATATMSQASDAPMKAAGMLLSTIKEKPIANASMPN